MLDKIAEWIWGPGLLALLLGTGFWLSVRNRFFQLWGWRRILSRTFGSLRKHKSSVGKQTLTQFQTFSAALAAAMGTGNIVGVAAALWIGGPGAIFWMWVSAFLGMMLTYCENVLGMRYAGTRVDGTPIGGPMAYLHNGLGCPALAVLYSIFCICASFGMGNMTQSSTMAHLMQDACAVPPVITGILVTVLLGGILLRGARGVGGVIQWLMPLLAAVYMLSAAAVILQNRHALPAVCCRIFQGAFGVRAACGGISGTALQLALGTGLRHGVFSNEAGLGSSALVHAGGDSRDPELQGLWSMTEVALDTLVCCTLTAFAVLTSGADRISGENPGMVIAETFRTVFGGASPVVMAVLTALFAFCTLIGWCCCGEQAVAYLCGRKRLSVYRVCFCLAAGVGTVLSLQAVWTISDIANGLMAVPNLLGILLLQKDCIRKKEPVSAENRKCIFRKNRL